MQTLAESPLMTVESFNGQLQIGEKEREAVKWGWEQETRYLALNFHPTFNILSLSSFLQPTLNGAGGKGI